MSKFTEFFQANGLELAEGKRWKIDVRQKIATRFDEIVVEQDKANGESRARTRQGRAHDS